MGFENGKLLRVSIEVTGNATDQVNTFHYDLDDGDVIDPDNGGQDLADTFRDDVVPLYRAIHKSYATIQPVVVTMEKDPQNPTAPRSQWTSGTPLAGTRTGSAHVLPAMLTAVATLRTANIGRRHRGRLFLGGSLDEDDQNNGSFNGTILTLWANLLAGIPREPDLAFGGSGASAKWCVYSRTQRAADLDPYASPITSANLSAIVHTLRSRAPYS